MANQKWVPPTHSRNFQPNQLIDRFSRKSCLTLSDPSAQKAAVSKPSAGPLSSTSMPQHSCARLFSNSWLVPRLKYRRKNSSETRPRWVIGWLVCFSIFLLLLLLFFTMRGTRWLFPKSQMDSCLDCTALLPTSLPLYLSFYVNEFNFAWWKLSRAHCYMNVTSRPRYPKKSKGLSLIYSSVSSWLASLGMTGCYVVE